MKAGKTGFFRGCLLLWAALLASGPVMTVGAAPVPGEDASPAPSAALSSGGSPLLAQPGRAEACGDVLADADLRAAGLEFLFCRREGEGRTARLAARYRVRGERAAAVERLLRERSGMAALERSLGIWGLPSGGEGRLPAEVFGAASACRDVPAEARVSMGEVPRPGVFAAARDDWGRLDWFAVRVDLPCAAQP